MIVFCTSSSYNYACYTFYRDPEIPVPIIPSPVKEQESRPLFPIFPHPWKNPPSKRAHALYVALTNGPPPPNKSSSIVNLYETPDLKQSSEVLSVYISNNTTEKESNTHVFLLIYSFTHQLYSLAGSKSNLQAWRHRPNYTLTAVYIYFNSSVDNKDKFRNNNWYL